MRINIKEGQYKDLLPALSEENYQALKKSVKKSKLFNRICVDTDGTILDGHHRWRVCQEIGMDPKGMVERVKGLDTDDQKLAYVLGQNLSRRQLSKKDRGVLFIRLRDKYNLSYRRIAELTNFSHMTVKRDIEDAQPSVTMVYTQKSERKPETKQIAVTIVTPEQKEKAKPTLEPEDLGKEVTKMEMPEGAKLTKMRPKKLLTMMKSKVQGRDGKWYPARREKTEEKEEVKPKFNQTNEKIEWAKWSWNPVSGCKHGCPYCYARDMAQRIYRERFEPTFRPERLEAPKNTLVSKSRENEPGIRNVFVCSMGDLFGEWVPDEWIDRVLESVKEFSQWNYLFLTKNPGWLVDIDWPDNAWVGTTVDVQERADPAVEAFVKVKARIKFISCEPLMEEVTFPVMRLKDAFDWMIIGGRSTNSKMPGHSESTPDKGQPLWGWVEHLLNQVRAADMKVYFKPNLTVRPKEYPNA